MFENFVTFTEVIKLSSNMFWRMREVNYHDKLLDLIYSKQDIVCFEMVTDLVKDQYLICEFIKELKFHYNSCERRWLENIFEIIKNNNITVSNDDLLISASKYGFYDLVKCMIENGANIDAGSSSALIWAVYGII